MLSLRKVLSVLAIGLLATGIASSPVEAARVHHHRSAKASSAKTADITARAIMEDEHQMEFTKFMKAHDKEYAVDELFTRYNIFKDNYKFIVEQNAKADAGVHTHRLAVGPFADMTNAEYRQKMLTYKSEKSSPAPTMEEWEAIKPAHWNVTSANIPDFWDWREHGLVTSVKNQGQCGSCWSFSATAAVESAHAKATGQLIDLSEQQLMDCDGNNADGCNGGYVEGAFDYIRSAGGQASYGNYPFTGAKGGCRGVAGGAAANINGYQRMPQDEGAMVNALANQGVMTVVLDGGDPNFQHYSSGIFSGPCGTAGDHAIAITGYGWDGPSNKAFWIMKNSWGNWGAGGYIYIQRGANICGCNQESSFATA